MPFDVVDDPDDFSDFSVSNSARVGSALAEALFLSPFFLDGVFDLSFLVLFSPFFFSPLDSPFSCLINDEGFVFNSGRESDLVIVFFFFFFDFFLESPPTDDSPVTSSSVKDFADPDSDFGDMNPPTFLSDTGTSASSPSFTSHHFSFLTLPLLPDFLPVPILELSPSVDPFFFLDSLVSSCSAGSDPDDDEAVAAPKEGRRSSF